MNISVSIIFFQYTRTKKKKQNHDGIIPNPYNYCSVFSVCMHITAAQPNASNTLIKYQSIYMHLNHTHSENKINYIVYQIIWLVITGYSSGLRTVRDIQMSHASEFVHVSLHWFYNSLKFSLKSNDAYKRSYNH